MQRAHPPVPEATRLPRRWLLQLRSLCLALLVTVGMSFVASASLADEPEEETVSAAVAAALEARLAFLEKRLCADLSARVEEKSRRLIERATDQQLTAMLGSFDPDVSSIPASYRVVGSR